MDAPGSQVVVGRDVFIASTAYVGGDVTFGDGCTVMHQAAIRGDVASIRIGNRVNAQDGAIIHTDTGVPLEIGDDVAIGHRAVIHCRRIGDGTLVGIGSIILDGCEIGRRCIIAAGAVVTPNTIVPDGKVMMGVPAAVVRDTTEAEQTYMRRVIKNYLRLGRLHAAGQYPNCQSPSPRQP